MGVNCNFFTEINHSDPIFKTKVQYFFDCWLASNVLMNLHPSFKCENHRTIINSIIYQIDNNSRLNQNYLEYYSDNQLLNSDHQIFQEFQEFDETIKSFKIDVANKEIQPVTTAKLKKFQTYLNQHYFDFCFDKIKKHLFESDSFCDHIEQCILYNVRLLIADYYSIGAIEEDIENVIDQVLKTSFNINRDNKFDFGYLKLDDEKFYSEVNDYYENRDGKGQIEEVKLIYEWIRCNIDVTFLVKSQFPFTEETIEFNFNNITFSSLTPQSISNNERYVNKISEIKRENPEFNYFFITVNAPFNGGNTQDYAYKKIKRNISVLEGIFEAELYVEPLYIYQGKHLNHKLSNVHNVPKNIEIVLQKSKHFLRGCYSHENEDAIQFLWTFFEEKSGKRGKSACNEVAKNIQSTYFNKYLTTLFNFLKDKYSLNIDDCKTAEEIIKVIKTRKHPLLKYILPGNALSKGKTSDYLILIDSILFEAYEQRNMLVHSGIYHEGSIFRNLKSLKLIAKIYNDDRS